MKKMEKSLVLGGVGMWLLAAACATPPEPFEYKQNNDLKPGPGIFTGEEGVFTIYGRPNPAEKTPGDSEEATRDDPVGQ